MRIWNDASKVMPFKEFLLRLLIGYAIIFLGASLALEVIAYLRSAP